MPPFGVSKIRSRPTIVIAILVGLCLPGCGSGEEEAVDEERVRRTRKTTIESIDPSDFKPKEVATHEVTIRTPVPGFYVLIDNEAARTSDNELLTTPCAVNVPAGTREIRISHGKFRDESRQIKVTQPQELNFDPFPVPGGDNASVRFAPYFDAPIGKGIPLLSINTENAELDPFLEPDGLAIWFVSKRPTGVGIYRASRPTQYHAFDEPRFEFRPPGSGDLPAASPSVTRDALLLVYTTPERGEIWGVPRPNALAGFEFLDRYRIKNTNHRTNWPAAQILYDSSQVFWVVDEDEEVLCRGSHVQAGRREAHVRFAARLESPRDRALYFVRRFAAVCVRWQDVESSRSTRHEGTVFEAGAKGHVARAAVCGDEGTSAVLRDR